MLKLKLKYFGHLMQRADSFEKTLILVKVEGRRRRGWQMMRWLDGITNSIHLSFGDGQGGLVCCSPWGHRELDTTEQLNWTQLKQQTKLAYYNKKIFYLVHWAKSKYMLYTRAIPKQPGSKKLKVQKKVSGRRKQYESRSNDINKW